MKTKTTMKYTQKMVRTLAVTLILIGLFAGGANAAVTFTFSQIGDDVVATASGSLNLAGGTRSLDNVFNDAPEFLGNTKTLLIFASVSTDDYIATVMESGLLFNPDSSTIPITFGYEENRIFVDGFTPLHGVVSAPAGEFRWSDTTIDAIGLGGLSSSTPFTVATLSGGGDTIQFRSSISIPEPSSALLLGLGLGSLGLIALRGRKKGHSVILKIK